MSWSGFHEKVVESVIQYNRLYGGKQPIILIAGSVATLGSNLYKLIPRDQSKHGHCTTELDIDSWCIPPYVVSEEDVESETSEVSEDEEMLTELPDSAYASYSSDEGGYDSGGNYTYDINEAENQELVYNTEMDFDWLVTL